MTFESRPIKGKRFSTKGIKEKIIEQMSNEGDIIERHLKKTTATWQGAKPIFKKEVRQGGHPQIPQGSIGLIVEPRGPDLGVSKWWWLELGTRIRWAVMAANFRSKTSPGRLRTRQGQGGAVIIGRRAMTKRGIAPRPGIEARNWRKNILDRRKKVFVRRMKNMMPGIAITIVGE